MVIRNPSDYVQSKYDDVKNLTETILSDGVQEVSTEQATAKESFTFDRSQNTQFRPRSFERNGYMTVRPYPFASNPMLTASDVTDMSASWVADGVGQVLDDGTVHIFFEAANNTDSSIAHATYDGGSSFDYDQIVLDKAQTGYDLALPWWAKVNGSYYMIPQDVDNDTIPLFKASEADFPGTWTQIETIANFTSHSDAMAFYHPPEDRWFIIFFDITNDDLRAIYSDKTGGSGDIEGRSWSKHGSNPLSTSNAYKRPAGPPVVTQAGVQTFHQEASLEYGFEINSRWVSEITPNSITWGDTGATKIMQGTLSGEWNDGGMHTIAPIMGDVGGPPLVIVDGKNAAGNWELGLYTVTDEPMVDGSAHLSSDTSVSGSSTTAVFYDTIDYTSYNNTSNFSKYYSPLKGRYRVTASVTWKSWGANVTTPYTSQLRLRKNGNFHSRDYTTVNSQNTFTQRHEAIVTLAKGDYVEAAVFHDAGDSVTMKGSESTRMDVELVSGI